MAPESAKARADQHIAVARKMQRQRTARGNALDRVQVAVALIQNTHWAREPELPLAIDEQRLHLLVEVERIARHCVVLDAIQPMSGGDPDAAVMTFGERADIARGQTGCLSEEGVRAVVCDAHQAMTRRDPAIAAAVFEKS